MAKCLSFLLTTFLFFLIGCGSKEKDPCKTIYCGLFINPEILFNIKDQQTNADWFFSPTPRYPFSAIHVTNPADTATWRVMADSAHNPPCLLTPFGKDGDLTLYIQVGNAKPDTFQCKVTRFMVGCCGVGVKTDNARLNGQPLNNSRLDTSILIIKK